MTTGMDKQKHYLRGEREGYYKALRAFELNVYNENNPDFIRGFEDAYAKARVKMDLSEPTVSFFKNVPQSLYVAYHLMKSWKRGRKGQYIIPNYNRVMALTAAVIKTGKELTWDAYKNYSTQVMVFFEEIEASLKTSVVNSVSNIPTILDSIDENWPSIHEYSGGRRIRYKPQVDQNTGEEYDFLDVDPATNKPQLTQRFKIEEKPGIKMEVLSDVYTKTPDGVPLYGTKDIGAVDQILNHFQQLLQALTSLGSEVQLRGKLYEDLVDLKNLLDQVHDMVDPENMTEDAKLPDLDTMFQIRDEVKKLADNKVLDSATQTLLDNIYTNIAPNEWYQRLPEYDPSDPNSKKPGFLDKLRGGANNVLLKVGRFFYRKDNQKILRGLQQMYANYDKVWSIIHQGARI